MVLTTFAQINNLPVKEWSSSSQTPFVLYISGDGGFNSFSTELCTTIHKDGYSITAVSAKSYFWDKKTPEQTATNISAYLEKQFKNRKNQQLVLAGYSFGSDVMPFIVNKLPDSIKKKLISVVMLSPSTSTDFEVHWSDIFGGNKKRNTRKATKKNTCNNGLQQSYSGSKFIEYTTSFCYLCCHAYPTLDKARRWFISNGKKSYRKSNTFIQYY